MHVIIVHNFAKEEEQNCLELLVIEAAEMVCTLVERIYSSPDYKAP